MESTGSEDGKAETAGAVTGWPEDFEPSMAEGLHMPCYCPRGETDCESLAQIISEGHKSFICCGRNDGTTRVVKHDKYRFCFKNSHTDEQSDNNERDLAHMLAVISGALAIAREEDAPDDEAEPMQRTDGVQ